MTSVTTLLAVITLFFYGGDMIHGFSTIMIIGILIGTLSSVFIAAPMLSWFRFSVEGYRALIAAKELRKKEKEEEQKRIAEQQKLEKEQQVKKQIENTRDDFTIL